MEDFAKYFRWELGNVQQGVANALKLAEDPLVLSDLFIQGLYGIGVDFAAQPVL